MMCRIASFPLKRVPTITVFAFLISYTMLLTVSEEMLSTITGKIIPKVEEWNCPPEPMYCIAWLRGVSKPSRMVAYGTGVCIMYGDNTEGKKKVLSSYFSEREGTYFWQAY